MFEQLEAVEQRFEALGEDLGRPEIASDPQRFATMMREYAHLREVVEAYRGWKSLQQEIADAREMLDEDDEDMREMAREELATLEPQVEPAGHRIKLLLLPQDPNDGRNVYLEIRAAAGGDEAGLFAADLYRMYQRFGDTRRWRFEVMSRSDNAAGGFKEIITCISGADAWSKLKFESGVHRVQRVPATESQGRIHTSTCTVALMPEADEVEVDINPTELRIDVYRASGPGGQSVNTTDSAVRITHLPSGLVVTCQDEKSQHKNKAKALKVLRTRLFDIQAAAQQAEEREMRLGQVGTGDRSERIRTYNFPQGRVTDHRIGLTLYNLDRVMMGELDPVLDPLAAHFEAEALKAVEQRDS